MSGPKDADVINYRALINAIKKEMDFLFQYMEKECENALELENDVKEVLKQGKNILECSETEKLWSKLKSNINEFQADLKKIKSRSKQIFSNNQDGLDRINALRSKVPENFPFESQVGDLKNVMVRESGQARKIKNEMIRKMRLEAKRLYDQDMEFIKEWVNNDEIADQIEVSYSKIATDDFDILKPEFENFKNLMFRAKNIALDNKNTFDIKAGNSQHILEVLEDMGFTDIERKLETDKFGNIIIEAQTPLGDWNLTFDIESGNEIKINTPYDDRCHTHLKDIKNRLEHKGLLMDIKQLKETRKTGKKMSQVKKERVRSR